MNLFVALTRSAMQIPELLSSLIKRIALLLLLLPCPDYTLGQKVNEVFSEIVFADNFDTDNGYWRIQSNPDNLFLIQNGEFFLKRINKLTDGASLCSWTNPCTSFEIKTSLKIEKGNGSLYGAGVLFMLQENRNGGLLFEINSKRQYRLRQLVDGNYKRLTGTLQNEGWTYAESIAEAGKFNLIRIAYSDKNYDIYVNETLVNSFSEFAYKDGTIGFTVGSGSTVHADFISISSTAACNTDRQKEPKLKAETETVVHNTSLLVKQLQEELLKLKRENSILKDSITKLNSISIQH